VKYTAVVLAGSRPGRDEFAHQFGTDMKALVAVGGEPMVRRPVRALLSSKRIADVIVLSQAPERIAAVIPSDPRVRFGQSGATIAETMLDMCSNPGTAWPLLVTTADHALLDAAMIDEFAREAAGADIAIGVVEQGELLHRLPHTRRTWLKFRDGAYTGSNLFALSSPAVRPAIELWRSVEQDRKKGWRLIWALGPLLLAGTALRLLSIDNVLALAGRKLGLTIRPARLSNPLAGVDVDKPADHELVQQILAGRA
jgi:GTP:adenosylcobinamide-phosphate guanylyltransferase